MGGVPFEFPTCIQSRRPCKRPTAVAGSQSDLYLGLVEILYRLSDLDGVVLTIGLRQNHTGGRSWQRPRSNIPAIALSGGPMLNGWHKGERTGSGTIRLESAREMLAKGEIDDRKGSSNWSRRRHLRAGLLQYDGHRLDDELSCRGFGHEPARLAPRSRRRYRDRLSDAPLKRARRIVEMVHENREADRTFSRARRLRTRSVVNSAIGGSTNAPIHLNAIARHIGVPN